MKTPGLFIRFGKSSLPTVTLLIGILLLLLSSRVEAAQGDFAWVRGFGQSGQVLDDVGYDVFVDSAGNVYTTGYFQGTVDFDPGPGDASLSSAGNNDIFITKMTSSGNLVWAKRIGSSSDDEGWGITVDASGNVYTTGYFVGTVDFDPNGGGETLTNRGSSDIFISKLDSNGNYVNAWSLGGTSDDYGFGIFLDPSGNIYTTGYFKNTLYFNPGNVDTTLTSASVNVEDIFITKLNSNGTLAWVKQIGGVAADVGLGVSLYSDSNIYITGWFQGTNVDFNPDEVGSYPLSSTGGSYDIFVLSLDSNGNFAWARRMGGVSEDKGQAVTVDPLGNVYTTGYFNGAADFDEDGTNDLISSGGPDIFISKMNGSSGALLWAKRIGETANDVGFGITTDSSNNVYTTGSFQGADVDFDPGETGIYPLNSAAGSSDIFISKLDSSGNFVWAKALGGTSTDVGFDIFVDRFGAVFTTGYFQGTADFDPGVGISEQTSGGLNDIFIMKLAGRDRSFPWAMFLPTIIGNR